MSGDFPDALKVAMKEDGLSIDLDPAVKARLHAECEVRQENDKVPWSFRRLVTQLVMRTLPPLSKQDEARIAAKCNGHQPAVKQKKQKAKRTFQTA